MSSLRLTQLTGAGGCSAKIAQADLAQILDGLAAPAAGELVVGAEMMDDAAVYRFAPDRWLVATTDFFPPPLDDPGDYGAVATANALSDVYAMGGVPLLLLNLVGYDLAQLPGEVLRAILAGGAAVAQEAGCLIAGGHSIRTQEPVFGCAVVGEVRPEELVRNQGARVGDRIYLTKPLGTGVALNAHRQERIGEGALAAAVRSMRTLNRDASRAMVAAGASAATDVTGFGLLGHAQNLARASGVRLVLEGARLPELPQVAELIEQGLIPGGSRRNLELAREAGQLGAGVPAGRQVLACDAQTSGGLLVCLAERAASAFEAAVPAAVQVGEVVAPAGEGLAQLV
ncbi:MAG: selenide, water dikinase SelD [Candidatus Dormibacteria bacterium]